MDRCFLRSRLLQKFGFSTRTSKPNVVNPRAAPCFVFRLEGRRLESRIIRMLDARLPGKNHTYVMSEWVQTLETTSPDEYGLMVPELAASNKKHLDEMLGEPNGGKND
ncbi:unnamed protein product [Caenorhabditis nigoni]